ncbi:hypothetical protein HanRHA438_Chr15g0724031 [Helianthus annuus]|nr:hypothetical protein HanIR_Chr15g0774571 [Helianthus annuus]KAJ0846368.1 hypothetical protein HanRHA438_Chr15g0724031 [Helianthus annuus]
MSFMFTSNCRRCSFSQKFTGGVLNLLKSCTFYPLGQTWLEISVNFCQMHMRVKYSFSLSTPISISHVTSKFKL